MAKPSRSDRRPVYFAVATGLFALAFGVAFLLDWQRNVLKAPRLEADLAANLPLGSLWEQAEAWFASHEIEVSVSDDGAGGRRMHATIPNNSFLECAEIWIELEFGSDGLLRSRLVRRQVYEL